MIVAAVWGVQDAQYPQTQGQLIVPGLYLGSAAASANEAWLHDAKISHILVAGTSIPVLFPTQFTYHVLEELWDEDDAPIIRLFAQCHTFIDAGRVPGNVLVHCNAGVSRSATIVMSYLMRTQSMSVHESVCHVAQARPWIGPNDGFIAQLHLYAEQLAHAADPSWDLEDHLPEGVKDYVFEPPEPSDAAPTPPGEDETPGTWQVDMAQITLGAKIGSGAFGDVYVCPPPHST